MTIIGHSYSLVKSSTKCAPALAAGGGDLTSRVGESGNDEVTELARSFNKFVATVQTIIIDTAKTTDSLKTNGENIVQLRDEMK